MKTKIEHDHLGFPSLAKYPVCFVIVSWKEVKNLTRNGSRLFNLLDRATHSAAKALNQPAKSIEMYRTITTNGPVDQLLVFRSLNYEEQARQSLTDMGYSDEDILNGKDMPFTDHTGIFMPREPNLSKESDRGKDEES